MEQGICKLCCNSGDLKRSHIIPEAFYKPLYDKESHLFLRLDSDAPRPKRGRKGLREPLLCPACEHITEVYDDYAIKIWNGTDTKAQYHKKNNTQLITNVDYTKMKLFFIITLWRASVSKLSEFDNISLGNKHENTLRQLILDKKPGREYEYPVILITASKKLDIADIVNGSIISC